MSDPGVVIVGTGHGGASAATTLRHEGYQGRITMVGDDPEIPYERPPLSKDFLAGEKSFAQLALRPERFWGEAGIDIRSGERVEAIDPAAHSVQSTHGTLAYSTLVWAAGGRPRRLSCPGHDFAGVHVIRTREDVEGIRSALSSTRHVVVIGGGYIGLETAAVLNMLGKSVVVLEALERVLARVAGVEVSRFVESFHRANGVDIRTLSFAESILGEGGSVIGVRLGDGEIIPAEMVISGIGIEPCVEPLLAAGAKGANGVEVDGHCRTSLPDVYAIGDCALHLNAYSSDGWTRLESVQNATGQGHVVAKNIAGSSVVYDEVPWFWSYQGKLRLQTVGLAAGHDDAVVRGSPQSGGFSVAYLRRGRVIAFDCVNHPRDFAQARALVAAQLSVERHRLADDATPLKSLS